MSGGLVDIHVLEETVSRVSDLTKSINKQVTVVEEVSQQAHKALSPASLRTHNLGLYKTNLVNLLKVYEEIEQATRDVNDLEAAIEAGPSKSGWQNYIALVTRAEELSKDLSLSPQLRSFPQLPESASSQYSRGIEKIMAYVAMLGKAVFTPLDAVAYIDSNDSVPPFNSEELTAFSKLISALDQWPEVIEITNKSLTDTLESFYTVSCASALERIGPKAGQYNVHAISELCEQYKAVVNSGLQILFNRNHQRLIYMAETNEKLKQAVVSKAKKKYTEASLNVSPSKAKQGPQINASPERGTGSSKAGTAKPVLNVKTEQLNESSRNSPAAYQSPVAYPSPSAYQSPAATTYPQSPEINQRQGSAPMGNSPQRMPSVSISSPTASATSSGTHSPRIGSTTTSNANDWAPVEVVDKSRSIEISQDDLNRAKRDSLAVLIQVFQGIEQKTRHSPITSEFGVSGASIQFMQTLKQLATYAHGVDVVLSELASRIYLTKPLPTWAQKSEPTAAGRANPVSQYFADCIHCLYANLHSVSTEQLKDVTRTGIFMLTNLCTIEHYITESKTETLSTMKRKSHIMDAMGDVALQKFQKLKAASFNEFLTDWRKLAPVLMETTSTSAGTKLSSKDREIVKDKFKTFNHEFEQLAERLKKYQIADPVLKASMQQEAKKIIIPLYTRFYMKHKDGDFTKNIGKYVKYDPGSLDRTISF